MTMFAAWVTSGTQIGMTAFFAVFVFALLAVVALGVLGLIASIAKWMGDGKDDLDRR